MFSILFGKTADAEDWRVNQPASWGVRILVYALDAMITIVGAIGPIALISIPLCLIADAF